MWIFTKYGAYSMVWKKARSYRPEDKTSMHIRSRRQVDLENLIVACDIESPEDDIHESTKADYRYRIMVSRATAMRVMVVLTLGIDYGNFKTEAGSYKDQKENVSAYHKIWSIMGDLQPGGPYNSKNKVHTGFRGTGFQGSGYRDSFFDRQEELIDPHTGLPFGYHEEDIPLEDDSTEAFPSLREQIIQDYGIDPVDWKER